MPRAPGATPHARGRQGHGVLVLPPARPRACMRALTLRPPLFRWRRLAQASVLVHKKEKKKRAREGPRRVAQYDWQGIDITDLLHVRHAWPTP